METNKPFNSPIQEYLAQKLQLSFDFASQKMKIKTFETPAADYEVRKVECYLTKEKALKEGKSLDELVQLKTKKRGSLFLSSSWYEIFTIYTNDLFENGCEGNEAEIAENLLWLELQKEHFTYTSSRNEMEDNGDGSCFVYRSLNKEEKKSLDNLIKQKLDNLYLTCNSNTS